MTSATMADSARSAGLEVIGESGTSDDVWAVWRPMIGANAVPTVRVADDDEDSTVQLQERWLEVARAEGLFSPSGEFLISFGSSDGRINPWLNVRLTDALDLTELGPDPTQPEFVATDLHRGVTIGVTSEEWEYWIFVAHTGAETVGLAAPAGS